MSLCNTCSARLVQAVLVVAPALSLFVSAETNEIIFSAYFVSTPVNISRLNLGTGQVTPVNVNPPIGNSGGATSYNGKVNFV